jgi:hypothetical protein
MERTHTRVLTDAELCRELQARETICFVGLDLQWQELERQVERLGFGELYIVSAKQRAHEQERISLKPLQAGV